MADEMSTAGSATLSAAAGTGSPGTSAAGAPADGGRKGAETSHEEFLADLGLLDGREAFKTGKTESPKANGAAAASSAAGDSETAKAGDSEGDTTTTEEETETEAEEAEAEEAKGASPKVQKRIDKLTKQKKELKEEVETLKGQMAELQKKGGKTEAEEEAGMNGQSGSHDSLGHVWTLEDLKATVNNARRMRDLLEDNPDGGVDIIDQGKRYKIAEGDGDSVRDALKFFRKQIESAIDRKEFLDEHKGVKEAAAKAVPDLYDEKSEAGKERAKRLKTPLSRQADADLFIADAIRGRKIREDEANGVKYTRVDPAKVKQLQEEAKEPAKRRVLPTPPAVRTVPMRSETDGPADAKAAAWEKSKSGKGVSIEELVDAEAV